VKVNLKCIHLLCHTLDTKCDHYTLLRLDYFYRHDIVNIQRTKSCTHILICNWYHSSQLFLIKLKLYACWKLCPTRNKTKINNILHFTDTDKRLIEMTGKYSTWSFVATNPLWNTLWVVNQNAHPWSQSHNKYWECTFISFIPLWTGLVWLHEQWCLA